MGVDYFFNVGGSFDFFLNSKGGGHSWPGEKSLKSIWGWRPSDPEVRDG